MAGCFLNFLMPVEFLFQQSKLAIYSFQMSNFVEIQCLESAYLRFTERILCYHFKNLWGEGF